MATCKNCIHEKVCVIIAFPEAFENSKWEKEPCDHFKDKTDYVEVKHGEWIDDIQKITTVAGVEYNGIVGYKCSLCGRREGSKEPFCNCGAKMGGGMKGENL